MSETLTQKIQNDFDRLALLEPEAKWDHNNHYHDFLLKQLPQTCDRVLEIGCGTGAFSRRLARRSRRVVAVDLSPNMIGVAKKRSKTYVNIDFQVADITKWEFPENQYDAIVSLATVHHLLLERLLPKLTFALKPGGKLAILDLVQREGLKDIWLDAIAVPLNWIFNMFWNRGIKLTPEAVEALREHMRTDRYLTLSQARQMYTSLLAGTTVRRHLFWRYSAVWEKAY
jgi:2-polyprenyl-3-methyl-5-hydroxy-6-metoxy-1,4-benzoquinol methylase